MEKILIEQNPHWTGERYEIVIDRAVLPNLIKLLGLEETLVLLGVRRCGKTTMFRSLINYLMLNIDPKTIFYINFDAPHFNSVSNDPTFIYTIIENAEKLTGMKVQYLFLDEVHNVDQWEKFVKSSYDSQVYKKILVTGSNAKLLHSDYITLLSGRYIDEFMSPMSYRELLTYHGINDNITLIKEKPRALNVVNSMLMTGSFPKPYLEKDEALKMRLLRQYYETILLKDCLAAGNLRDARLLKELAHYLLTNIGTRYSYNNLTEYVNSNEHTVKDYITILQSGYLIDEVQNFSFSLKKQARGKKKTYCVDNGLINAVAFNFFPNEGQLLENLVFTELKKNGITDIFVYNEQKECDFITKQGGEFVAIQVCHTITLKNRAREIEGLELGMTTSKAKRGIIITYDQAETLSENIDIIPFWKYFFEQD
jgi:predicted AAA+ superfamily ATPase